MVTRPLSLTFGGLSAAALLAAAGPSFAAAFYVQEQSPRGVGRAFSGEVADTGVESLWWNPAAVARSSTEGFAALHGVFPTGDVTDRGSTITYPVPPAGLTVPVGGDPRAEDPIFKGVVPNVAFTTPIGDRFALAVGIFAPFGFQTKYSTDSFARYESLKSRLYTADFQFTGAWRATDWLDIGASVDAQFADAKINNAVPNLPNSAPPPTFLPDGFQELSGQGWDVGWSIGVQAHPNDRLSLGASYRSKIEHEINGFVSVSGLLGPLAAGNFQGPGTATFTTPWSATFGVRYRLMDKLWLNGQAVWYGWNEFDNITVRTAAGTTVLPENYENTVSGAIGVDYNLDDRWTLRGGVQFDPTPTPDSRDLRVPDSDRWLFNAGASYRAGSHLTVDGAFGYVNFTGSDVNGDKVFFGGTAAQTVVHQLAEVEGHAWVGSIGLHWTY